MNLNENKVFDRSLFMILMILFVVGAISSLNCSYGADEGIVRGSVGESVSQKDIVKVSSEFYKNTVKNEKVPDFVTVGGKSYTSAEFLYLMSKTIVNKNKAIVSNIDTVKVVKGKSVKGTDIKGKLSSKKIYSYSKHIVNYVEKNNKAPSFISTSIGKMKYETVLFTFAKYLSKTKTNGKLVSSVSISLSKKSPINNNGYTVVLFNSYKKGDSLRKYLAATKNAPKNDVYIVKLANKVTKGETTVLGKAKAIFDWIKTNIKYSRYSNTKSGGKKTIKLKKGNCVDTSHALVTLLRASGIPARYLNGRCSFTKGDLKGVTVSHVWVQVLVGKKWMVADGIYKGNRLGYVGNWKVNSYSLYGKYPSI
jgi:hypothetical protein